MGSYVESIGKCKMYDLGLRGLGGVRGIQFRA